jgi:hypothetical protein
MTAPKTLLFRDKNKSTAEELEDAEQLIIGLYKLRAVHGSRITPEFAERRAADLRADYAREGW